MEKWWNKQVDAMKLGLKLKILKPYAEELRDLIKIPNDLYVDAFNKHNP